MRKLGFALPLLPLVMATSLGGNALADDGRFTLEKVAGGYVRLNTVTGEVSFCEEKSGQFVCRVSPSERMAYENEIRMLHDRLDMVEDRLAQLEGSGHDPGSHITSEEEFEKTLGFMEKFFRRFMGIVKDFDKEFGEDQEPEAGPEKT